MKDAAEGTLFVHGVNVTSTYRQAVVVVLSWCHFTLHGVNAGSNWARHLTLLLRLLSCAHWKMKRCPSRVIPPPKKNDLLREYV